MLEAPAAGVAEPGAERVHQGGTVAEEYFQERTERATPRRREQARQEGQVARSREIANAVVLLAMTGVLAAYGSSFFRGCRDLFATFCGNLGLVEVSPQGIVALQARLVPGVLALLAPLGLTALISGLAVNLLQVGVRVTPKPLAPRLNRIDPVRGLKRIFSIDSLVELIKSLIKIAVVGWVAWGVVRAGYDEILPAAGQGLGPILSAVGSLFLRLGVRVGIALLVLAALDYGYQRWRYEKNIMMTRKETEEELKHQEGSPQVKSRVRAQQRRLSWQRMMAAVPKADVVITNPLHFAVAVRYDRAEMRAPKVVAKGARKTAQRIREVARRHSVPVVEDPPLARVLYRQVEVGQMIPVELFEAVARVLAYVYRLQPARRRHAAQASV
ncbi:MAG: flagellar biosynthesis protein FlhB [Candidatus Eisenbacteria bacterium]|nr:flagellar biosynthesis protein FlhB [Candidatus Eisenbacteria bacterium]